MNCPRCKGNNLDNLINCQKCGLKLKVTCPRCKSLNPIGKEKCFKCNLRLITFCSNCKAPNHPTSKNCRKCSQQLLKQCGKCKAINPIRNTNCFKCSEYLAQGESQPKDNINDKLSESKHLGSIAEDDSQGRLNVRPSTIQSIDPTHPTPIVEVEKSLDDYAVIYVELINLAAIKSKLGQGDVLQKIMNKFYQLLSIESKRCSEKLEKINNQLLSIKFRNCRSIKSSSTNALISAQNILRELDNLNYVIRKNFSLKLKIKIGAVISKEHSDREFAKHERAIGATNDIIVNKDLFKLAFNKFDFEKIGPIIANDEMVTFYKLKYDLSMPVQQANELDTELEKNKKEEMPGNKAVRSKKKKSQDEETLSKKVSNANNRQALEQSKTSEFPDNIKALSQEEIYNTIVNMVVNGQSGNLVNIAAPDGSGKTTIMNSLCQHFSSQQIIWMMGQCSSVNQFVPFACISDLLKTLFSLPVLTFNVQDSKKQVLKSLDLIGIKNKQVEKTLFRLLFQEDLNSNIYEVWDNLNDVYECLNTIISSLNVKSRIVIFIDDFEFIDKASMDYFKYLFDNSFLNQGNNVIINHLPGISINKFFNSFKVTEKITSINLKPLSPQEMEKLAVTTLNGQDILPAKVKTQIFSNAKGSPVYMEQALWLLYQNQTIYNDNGILKFNSSSNFLLPDTSDALTQLVISKITTISPELLNLVSLAAILGQKFIPGVLLLVSGMESDKFNGLLELLFTNGIFIQLDANNIAFKHKILWKTVFEKSFTPEQKINAHKTVLETLKKYTKINSCNLAIHAELGGDFQEAAGHWSESSTEALSVGDIKAYSLAQERILLLVDLINNIEPSEKETIKLNISEQLGKINYLENPQDGVKYLSHAITQSEKSDNIIKTIELSGFLAKAWELLGKPFDAVECVDKVINNIDKNQYQTEVMLLNYSKLESLFSLGRLEETCIIAKNAIIPILNVMLSKQQSFGTLSYNELVYILFDAELILARALAFQGNKECILVAESLINKSSEFGYSDFVAQARIVIELFYILQGKVNTLNIALEHLSEITPTIREGNFVKMHWDFINLVYSVLTGNYELSKKISHLVISAASFHKNHNIQSLSKLLTAKMLKESDNKEQAKALLYEVLNYCSENKMATEALLGWYFIAEQEMEDGNTNQACNIAEKALEIAKKPDIQNHLFEILLQKLLAEIKITKGDFEMAQVYIKGALDSAKSLELFSLESQLLLTYGKMYQELAAPESGNNENKESNIRLAYSYHKKALEIAGKIENNYLQTKIDKEITNLNILSNLSGIGFQN